MTSTLTDRIYGESASVAVKAPCVAVSAGQPLLLQGLGAVGGYVPQVNDRILVKDQVDDPTANGIYNASNGAWTRSGDFDGIYDAVQGTLIVVISPTSGGSIFYQLTTVNPIIGTTPLNFASFINPTSINYALTEQEFLAGVVPVNFSIPPRWVTRYGAVGDSVTNDQPAFANALRAYAGQSIIVPDPPGGAWLMGAGLVVPANTAVLGSNKRSCKLLCGGNFDLITLNDGGQLYRLYLEGNAKTGHGLQIPSGANNQTVQNCRIINFAPGAGGGAVNFADNTAGSRCSFHDIEAWQTNGVTGSGFYAFFIPDVFSAAAVPRKFSHIETSGNASFFFGGCNDLFITGSFICDLKYSTNSRSVQISASRVANTPAVQIDGSNHSWVGVDTFPQLILPATLTNSKVDPGSTNISLTAFNTITALTAAAAAVATISTISATNPIRVGTKVFFDNVGGMTQINGLYGNVTAIGGASGAWTVTTDINSGAFTAFTAGGNLSAPAVVDLTGANNSVQVYQQRQVYNPILASGGAAPALGNGSLSGFFARAGSIIEVWIDFTVGSTTNLGSGDLRYTLPIPKQDGEVMDGGGVVMNHAGTINTACTQIPGNVNFVTMLRDTSGAVTATSPQAFATGDTFRLHFSYSL